MRTPLHEHELMKVNPLNVYHAFAGHWKCDHCNATSNALQFPFHCTICSFDLCASCAQIEEKTLAHQHPLLFREANRQLHENQGGHWKCQVCKKVGTAEACSYHCRTCTDFHICRSCFEPKQHPVHVHKLELVDTSLLYTECSGKWFCDICGSQSRPCEKLAYHCSECGNFDVCPHCYLPLVTPLHGHVLYKANSYNVYAHFNGGWKCDHCSSAHDNPTSDTYPWHCQTCEYDLCQMCARHSDERKSQDYISLITY